MTKTDLKTFAKWQQVNSAFPIMNNGLENHLSIRNHLDQLKEKLEQDSTYLKP